MEISGLKGEFLDLKMPVWTPGSYLIREYSKNVERITTPYDYDSEGLNTLEYTLNETIEIEDKVKKVKVDL